MADLKPTVSIIVPVYNVEPYLKRCIESILSQTYKNLEIILVVDGSADLCSEICDEYSNTDDRIKVIHKLNGGVSSARNFGLKVATGDYIGFVDADDYIKKGMYQALVSNVLKFNTDISICGFLNEVKNSEAEPYCKEDILRVLSGNEQIECLLKNKYYSCSCWDRIFKNELLNDVFFDEKITNYEDLLFLYWVTKKSKTTVFDSTPYYFYATNEGSAAVSKFNAKKMTMIDVCTEILNDVKNNLPDLYECALTEFVRNNLMCAGHAAKDNYTNKSDIKRFKENVRKNLWFYINGNSASGYKLNAILLSISWNVFKLLRR